MEHQQLEWSPTHGWMALASYNAADRVGQINFFTHTGSQTEDSVCTRSSRPTSLAWHTSEAVLAGGWEDGKVVLVGPGNDFNLEISDEALQEIMCIRWNVQGTHLCVADKVGTVIIFRVELRGGAKYTKQHTVELKEHATSICTRNLFEAIKSEKDLVLEDDVHDDDFENAMKERQRKIGVRLSQDQLPAREPCASMFIIGTLEGTIFGVAQDGTLLKVFKAETEIVQLYYLEQKSMVVALTIDYILYQILIASDHTGAEKLKAKLPGKPGGFSMELSDKGTLLVASSEKEIRVWDLIGEENYTLSLQSQKGFAATDTVTCVAFSKKKGVISGGTAEGKIATWRKKAGNQREQADMWKLQPPNVVGEKILSLKWSPVAAALAVNTGSGIHIMQDDTSIAHFRKQVAAVQNSQNHFSLVNTANGVSQDLKLPFPARGIHLADKQLVVWGLETVMTYDVQTSLATFQSTSFQCNATSVVFYNQNLYCLEADKVNVRTLQGTVKQIISLPEMEGDPCTLDLSKNWMVISTTNGFLRIYDLSRREAKQEYHSKYVIEAVNDFYKFVCVKLNSTGTRVACTFLEKMNELSDKILVWDAEADNVGYFSFDKGMTDQQEYEVEAELASSGHRPVTAAARKMEREQSRYRMMYHRPGALFWDETDSRFLVCEAVYQNPEMGDNQLLSMFVTAEHSIQLQDIQPRSVQCDQLIGVNVPQLYFMKKSEYDEEEIRHEKIVGRQLVAKTMREFAGLDGTNDENTKKAMLDFCLYLTLGHMDEAFKAIKFIKSGSVWEDMAVMAVKTRRLDVAQVCLGNMGLVRGSKALRKSQKRGDPPLVQCATLALHLGMMEEAESLYKSTGRYDLLNKFYQAQNAWAPAYETAEKHDRIHLRNTYYNHAMCLEANGAIEQAIEHYEKSETHNFEIPRMFVDNPKILESYVRRKRDPELQRWWARYLESIGELEGAVNFYKVANDHLSVVRIRCVQGEIDEAAKIAGESGDRAACYHLARNYEADGNYEQAVHFYTKAYAFSSAIRLAKEHDMKERLANLCLMAGGSDLVEAARYYEDLPGYAHKAVMLYHKAGMIGRALDLAFRTEQFSALDLIAKDLSPTTDATTLKRAAEFFTNNNNFEKAVELLCFAKDYRGAVDLCSRKNVRMTDKLAELLTPTKENTPKNEERKALLEEVAELCVQQGFYQFAAKKYTQAGDKLMAMRALLKSGDTGKIRFFANTARSKDIYILAANYLQTTDWRSDPEVTKDIESFYNKSQSHEHLASFYQTCAFMEIEDYRDFEGAAQALESAQKAIAKGIEKGTNVASLTEQQKTVTQYQNQIKKFQKIKGVYDSDPTDAVRQLHSFAEESTEDDLIRPSHIFALLIGHHAGKQNWSAAYRCIQQLKKQSPKLDLTTVVSADVLDQVCDEMKVERITAKARASDGESDGEAEVEFSYAMQRQQRQKESK